MNLDFKRNLGVVDRIIRIAIGLMLVSLSMMRILTNGMSTVAVYLGIFLVLETAIGY